MKLPISLAIADDHSLFRESLCNYFNNLDTFEVLFDAGNGKELIDKIEKFSSVPDVCLLDLRMPVMNGYSTLQYLVDNHPQIKILILSSSENEEIITTMIKHGAKGFLSKRCELSQLEDAINNVHTKGFHYNDFVCNCHLKIANLPNLTSIEREFLAYCSLDLSYKEIAVKMKISNRKVESLRESTFDKLNVSSRVGLVLFAVKNDFILPDISSKYVLSNVRIA